MKQSQKSIFYRICALLLTVICLTGCMPQISRPAEEPHSSSQTAGQTTPAPGESGHTSESYEQYDEKKLVEQRRFSEVEEQIFRQEASRSRLDLHFLLRDPASAGIDTTSSLYTPVSLEEFKQNRTDRKQLKKTLASFSPSLLTDEQKLTLQILESFLRTESKSDRYPGTASCPPLRVSVFLASGCR